MITTRALLASRWVKAAGVVLAGACALAAATSHGASNGGVLKVRMGGDSRETRVVVELDRSAKAKLVPQEEGSRAVVLSWPDVKVNADLKGAGKGLVTAWTVDKTSGDARLKLELAGEAEVVRRFLLPPADGVEVYRYVVDLKATRPVVQTAKAPSAPQKPVVETPVPKALAKTTEPKSQAGAPVTARVERVAMMTAPKAVASKPVIVIDAGHGGRDPGAQGEDAREKGRDARGRQGAQGAPGAERPLPGGADPREGRLRAAGAARSDRPPRRRGPVHLAPCRRRQRSQPARRQRLHPVGERL
jgi:N-acetylmuramoyl-L-alanine amidase